MRSGRLLSRSTTPRRAGKGSPGPRLTLVIRRGATGDANERHHFGFDLDLPPVRTGKSRAHADRRLPVVLRVRGLPRDPTTEARRLLCVLLLWFGAMPAGSRAWQTGGLLRLSRRSQSAPSQVPRARHRRPDLPRARPGVARVTAAKMPRRSRRLQMATKATVWPAGCPRQRMGQRRLLPVDYTAIIPQDSHPDS